MERDTIKYENKNKLVKINHISFTFHLTSEISEKHFVSDTCTFVEIIYFVCLQIIHIGDQMYTSTR